MSCRLCRKPIQCDYCEGVGEIECIDLDRNNALVECPTCNNLHPKCFRILNSLIAKWQQDRKAQTVIS